MLAGTCLSLATSCSWKGIQTLQGNYILTDTGSENVSCIIFPQSAREHSKIHNLYRSFLFV